jgi:hypothetical protein
MRSLPSWCWGFDCPRPFDRRYSARAAKWAAGRYRCCLNKDRGVLRTTLDGRFRCNEACAHIFGFRRAR